MITKAKIGNGEKIAEGIRTNNNKFHKYTRNKRSMGETVVSVCGREGKLVAEAAGKPTLPSPRRAHWRDHREYARNRDKHPGGKSEKLMKQRMRAEQVKKEKEENRAAKQ